MKGSKLLVLAAPLVLSFWLRSAFAWIDTVFASMLHDAQGVAVGDASIAAIGLTLPLEFLLTACWVGASNGLTSRLATAMGERAHQKVAQLKVAALKIIAGLAIFFVGLGGVVWLSSDAVGLEPILAHQFRIYATVLMIGSAISSFWSILPDSLIKAHHDTRATMWAGLASSLCNVVFNAFFLFICHWGILGIALSTVIGRFAGLAYALHRARHHETRRIADPEQQIPGLLARPIRGILVLAVPSALGFVLLGMESLAVNWILKEMPHATSNLAAWSLFDQSVRFLAMPMIALGVGMLPLVARLKGEGKLAEIRFELKVGLQVSFLYVGFFVLPLVLFVGPWLSQRLTDTERTALLVSSTLWWMPAAVAGLAPFLLCRATFDGLQRPRPALTAAILRTMVCVIPLVWWGSQHARALGFTPVAAACAAYVVGASLSGLGFWAYTHCCGLPRGRKIRVNQV